MCGCYHLFHGSYSSGSTAQDDHFTACDIQAYIPFVSHPSLAYPLVAADIHSFDPKYLAFELPDDDLYKKQCLCQAAEFPGLSEDEIFALFSVVKYYPPPDDLVEEAEQK